MARYATAPVVPGVDRARLSEQQRQICDLADRGMRVKEIAVRLRTTPQNVKYQLHVIRSKDKDSKSGTSDPPGVISALEGLSEFDTAHLTGRQQEVIGLLRDGRRTRDIARHFGISSRAVRGIKGRATLRLVGPAVSQMRVSRVDEDIKIWCANRYGERDPFRPEPSEEEKVRKRKFAQSTAGWVYRIITRNAAEEGLPEHEAQKALGREGHGGGEARKAIAGARAKGIKVLAVSSRHKLIRIAPENRRLLQDVLAKYFRIIDEGVYLEVVGGARSMLKEEYLQRRQR